MDAQQLEDGLGRNVLLQRCVIEARVERGAGLGLRGLDVAADGLRGGDIVAPPVARHGGEVVALEEDADLDRLHLAGVGRRRHQREAELLAGFEILGGEDRRQRLDDVVRLGGLGAGLGEQALQRVAAADDQRLALGAGEHLVVEFVLIVVSGVIGGFLDHRHMRRGGESKSVFGMIGRLQELRAAVADRAGHLARAVSVSEILGRLGDQLIDLVGPELDAVGLRQDPARHVDHVDADGLRRVVGRAARADRRLVGIELEGIEGRKFGGIGGKFGGKSGDDAQIGLDGDELAAALPLDHRVVDHLAADEARRGHLNAVFLLAIGALPVLGERGAAHRLQRREARPLERAHHARAVAHVQRRVDRDPDEADADHAGETGAREPFQPAACPIGARFAEIDRRQLALRPWHLAEKDGWESGSGDRH